MSRTFRAQDSPKEALSWRFVQVGETSAHIAEAHRGDEITLLVLHGYASTPEHADRRTIEKLASSPSLAENRCRLIAPVLPGFGRSSPLGSARFTLEDYADWCRQLLKTLEVRTPLVVLGESMGGALAITMAAQQPDVVRCVALFNSAGGYLPERNRLDWLLGVARLSLPSAGSVRQWLSSLFDAMATLRHPYISWRLAGLVVDADLRPALRRLAQCALPVVAVFSRRDPVVIEASAAAFSEELGIETLFVDADHRSFLEGHPAIEAVVAPLLHSVRSGIELEHDPARRISREVRSNAGILLTVEDASQDNGHE